MIILGLLFGLAGWLFHLGILSTIGCVLLIIGVALFLLGLAGGIGINLPSDTLGSSVFHKLNCLGVVGRPSAKILLIRRVAGWQRRRTR